MWELLSPKLVTIRIVYSTVDCGEKLLLMNNIYTYFKIKPVITAYTRTPINPKFTYPAVTLLSGHPTGVIL